MIIMPGGKFRDDRAVSQMPRLFGPNVLQLPQARGTGVAPTNAPQGTAVFGGTCLSTNEKDRMGGVVKFAGSYMSSAIDPDPTTGVFEGTLATWVFIPSYGAGQQSIFGNFNISDNSGWLVRINTNGALNWFTNLSTNVVSPVTSQIVLLNQWQHVAMCSYDRKAFLYVNGSCVLQSNVPPSNSSYNACIWGALNDGTSNLLTGYMNNQLLTRDVLWRTNFVPPIKPWNF